MAEVAWASYSRSQNEALGSICVFFNLQNQPGEVSSIISARVMQTCSQRLFLFSEKKYLNVYIQKRLPVSSSFPGWQTRSSTVSAHRNCLSTAEIWFIAGL